MMMIRNKNGFFFRFKKLLLLKLKRVMEEDKIGGYLYELGKLNWKRFLETAMNE